MIDYNDMKDKIEEIGYYATEELLYDTYNALYMIDEEEKQIGQDIYAICLEGPPGGGKTAFAKTYTEICKKMVDDKHKTQKEASPSMAVEILGLDVVPTAGDQFNVLQEEKEAREIIAYRTRKELEAKVAKRSVKSLDSMLKVII